MVNGERLNADDERESHGGINGDGEGVGSVHDDVDLVTVGTGSSSVEATTGTNVIMMVTVTLVEI